MANICRPGNPVQSNGHNRRFLSDVGGPEGVVILDEFVTNLGSIPLLQKLLCPESASAGNRKEFDLPLELTLENMVAL
jgi:hypothetical protein